MLNIIGKVYFHLLIFVFLSTLAFAFFFREYSGKNKSYHKEKIQDLNISFRAVVNAYEMVSRNLYEEITRTPEIMTLLEKANHASEKEKKNLRTILLEKLESKFFYLAKQNFKEFHFYLADSSSFLRFHSPERYGDKQLPDRESFSIIAKTGTVLSGYERGKINDGFRYIYPFSYRGKYIGSMGTCISFDAIRQEIEKIFPLEFSFIINKNEFMKTEYKDKWKNMVESDLSPDYLYEKNILRKSRSSHRESIPLENIMKINARVKMDNTFQKRLKEGNSFCFDVEVDKIRYIATFVPIYDLSGNHAAYIISYSENKSEVFFWNDFLEKSFMWSVLIFLFVSLFYLGARHKNIVRENLNKLRKSRAMFETMASNVPGVIYRWYQKSSGECGYSYVSPRAKEILGISARELMEDYTKLQMHPEDFSRWKNTVRKAFEKRADWSFEGRFILPDNRVMWWRGDAKPVPITEDEIVFDGIMYDITRRKEAELKIKENEKRLRLVLESMPILMLAMNEDRNIIVWNRECEKSTGYNHGEVVDNPEIFESMFPGNLDHIRDLFSGNSEDFLDVEFDLCRKDGSIATIKWSKVSGRVNVSGWHSWLIGVDVTHRKETEETLWQRDLLLGATSQMGTLLLSAFDTKGAITESLELLGPIADVDIICVYECVDEADDVLARLEYKWISEKLPSEANITPPLTSFPLKKALPIWYRDLSQGDFIKGMIEDFPDDASGLLKKFGAVSALITPIILHGKLWGFLSFYDCREKKTWSDNESAILETVGSTIGSAILRQRAEENLKEAMKKAEEAACEAKAATMAKSEFLANMSHDIRTPLNGIVGMAQILNSTTLDEPQKQYVEAMLLSSELLLSIINDILDLSKIEAGKLDLENEPFNLRHTLDKLCRIMRYQAEKKGLKMLFDYPDDIPLNVKGDEVRIRQIAMNLISNALKFTHEGYVRLRVGTEQEGENKTVFTIQVEDTGIGIPQDKRDLLFEKFTQVEKSTTRVYGGTGLGLSICKMLATKMNGKITVAPSDSGGSVFAVTLPLETVPFLIPEPDTSYTLEWLRPPRILIVEDSPINQKIASTILEKNGCNTDVAQDGEVALDRLRKEDFDLIFMDLQMPIMNGLEATIAIRASRELFSTIPIIAMTANAMHEEKENCLLAGMNNYLTKPIQEPELKKVLRKQLPSLIKSVSNESGKQPQPVPERSGSVEKIKEIPILDTESALEAIGGHEELLKKLLRVFIENIPEDIDELEKFIASDFKKAAGKAHKLKGESASIGAKKLNILALELEKAAKAENKGRLKKLLSEFKDILKETEKAVEKFSGSDSSSQ